MWHYIYILSSGGSKKFVRLIFMSFLFVSQLGWMSFVESPKTSHRLCRMAVIALWTLVIVIAMVTQIMSCFRRDSVSCCGWKEGSGCGSL